MLSEYIRWPYSPICLYASCVSIKNFARYPLSPELNFSLSWFSCSTLMSSCSLASDVLLLPLCPPPSPPPHLHLRQGFLMPSSPSLPPSQHFILFSTLVLRCYFSLSPAPLLAWQVYNSLLHSVRLILFTSPQPLYTLDVWTEMQHLKWHHCRGSLQYK